MDATNDPELVCPTCSTECTPADLPLHKTLCTALAAAGPPPSPDHILGLLFPAPAPAPAAVWVRCNKAVDDETSISFSSVDVAPFVPPTAAAAPDALYTERNTRRGRETARMLEIWTGGGAAAEPNACIRAVVGDETFHAWVGPVLALAMTKSTGFMVDPGHYRDVALEDCVDVVDFLADYENPEHGRRLKKALDSLGARSQELVDGDVEEDDVIKAGAVVSKEDNVFEM